MPGRYATGAKPVQLKKSPVSEVKHLQAPLKGLSLNTKLVTGDALTALILDNWTIEKDRVTVRPGLKRLAQLVSQAPITTILPWYGGPPDTMVLAAEGKLYAADAVTVIRAGFTSDNWNWTAFSNLGEKDYTVAVNGADGVWSWDGGSVAQAATVAATSLSNANPAVVTVAAADIGKFSNGQVVKVIGADATHSAANGIHTISSVGTPANTFTLVGVDTSAASGPQTTNIDVIPYGSIAPEAVTAPAGKTYVDPNKFHTVLSHMNRLWFADRTNLALYYLPLQQKSGVLKELPLNALFRRGGSIAAIYSWTIDGGAGVDDQLAIFSTNSECVIFNGTDPDDAVNNAWNLTGIFRFDSPMSMKSVIQYGGDLYVFCSTGFVPMSTMLRAEGEQLGAPDKNVTDAFTELTADKSQFFGWQAILDYNHGWAILNFPTGAPNVYRQMVRFMPDPVWATWRDVPARCWQWLNKRLFLGSDDGVLYEMTRTALSDNGKPITADLQPAWSTFNSAAIKKFVMVNPYIITDGTPHPFVDIRVDYDTSPPFNQPDVSMATPGGIWDVATWDVDYWAQIPRAQMIWQGVSALGRVGAPRLKVSIVDCVFSVAGFDVLYEKGAAVG
jgi:hypothetical protein